MTTQFIDSFQTDDCHDDLFLADSLYRRTAAKDMPIGNLTSQIFAIPYFAAALLAETAWDAATAATAWIFRLNFRPHGGMEILQ